MTGNPAAGASPRLYVLHENPDWYAPLAAAFDRAGVPHQPWLLGSATLDLDAPPPQGVFWSRMSASAHTRAHPYAKDQTRGVLSWLQAHGRRVVNGRRVLDLEMSKAEQLIALKAAGIEVPRTLAVAGRDELSAAARRLPAPFISKHNQGGKGLGVRLFASHEEFDDYLRSPAWEVPVDGITLLQEYLRAAQPRITRAEIVGGEFIYAITADTARGGFELCPADACAIGGTANSGAANNGAANNGAANNGAANNGAGPEVSLFALREGFDDPVIGRYLEFARQQGIEIAGFEFIETTDGRLVTYDINTTTNYNAGIEAVAPRPALSAVAAFAGRLLSTVQAAGHGTGPILNGREPGGS